jgi:esterase/lipase
LRQELNGKSLAIVLPWFLAKSKHFENYCKLYTDLGFDVLVIRVQMLQFLRPTKGTQVVASDVLRFLASNESYERISLHGLSVGGYVWGECLVQLRENKKFNPIEKRIKSQVWDSIATAEDIGIGMSRAMFPQNLTLQELVKRFIDSYLERSEQTVTKHYTKSNSFFNHQSIDAPALMFYSKTDPIGSYATNNGIASALRSSGRRLTTKVFDDSPHVGHLKHHRDDYLRCLMDTWNHAI